MLPRMKSLYLTALIFAAVSMVGCGSDVIKVDRLYKITLQTEQFAMDRDSSGMPDSVALQIMMYGPHKGQMRSVMGTGITQINIFDGSMTDVNGNIKQPFYTWEISPQDLRKFASNNYGLLCYRMALGWPPTLAPRHNNITLQARYISPDGIPVDSVPVEIKLQSGY